MHDPIAGSSNPRPPTIELTRCGDCTRVHGRVRGELAAAGRACDGHASSLQLPGFPQRTGTRRVRAWRVLAVCVLVFACGVAPAQPADSCERRLLEELGWRFVATCGGSRHRAGAPCDRADLAEAQAAGDLVVRFPTALDAARTPP